jgi:hypothetical protein
VITSLKVPHGTEGTVIDIQRLKRRRGDELLSGVDEMVKVLIATKRKLRQGDKMAGPSRETRVSSPGCFPKRTCPTGRRYARSMSVSTPWAFRRG